MCSAEISSAELTAVILYSVKDACFAANSAAKYPSSSAVAVSVSWHRTVLFGQRNGNHAPRRRKSPYLDGLILLEHHGIADDFRKTQLIGRRARHIEFVAGLERSP